MTTQSTYRPGSGPPRAETRVVHGPHAADRPGAPQGAYGIRARPLPMLLAALVWSWAWWAGSIALGGVETLGGALVYLVGGFGPAVAVVATLWRSSSAYRSAFRRRLLMGRVPPIWWLAAVLLAVSPKLVAMAVAAAGGHVATGESISLVAVPVSLAFGIMVVAIEEPLWRGVALDAFGPAKAKASLVIGLVWSAWHMPLFAVKGTFQHELGLGTVDFFVFSIGVVGLSVLLTWLVVGSGGSILLAMVAHFLINMTGNFLPDDTTIRVLEMIVIWLVAAALLYRLRRREGSRARAGTALRRFADNEDAR
jgi:membrane protease YdiL (CAAX protease family)